MHNTFKKTAKTKNSISANTKIKILPFQWNLVYLRNATNPQSTPTYTASLVSNTRRTTTVVRTTILLCSPA